MFAQSLTRKSGRTSTGGWLRKLKDSVRRGSEAPELQNGDLVAERYRIDSKLGAGGMAVVYRAHDLELDEWVALKFLRREASKDDTSVQRLKQEIKLARSVVHSNVCRTFDIGTWGKIRFVTMEFLDGDTLQNWYRTRRRIDLNERISIFRGILAGLEAAHQQAIVHRDLKPQNIMVTEAGRPVLMDFGIAHQLSTSPRTSPDDSTYGTPAYMAPERILESNVDARSDLYSLGVILFELVTGFVPFSGRSLYEIANKHLKEVPPRPSDINPEVPEWLDRVTLRLLEKTPDARYQTVAQVLADLPVVDQVGRRSVLLVDDDENLLTLLRTRLEEYDLVVRTAKDGASGIESVMAEPPDLICVDLHMPVMDGFDFLTYLQYQKMRNRVPVFMWSSVRDPQYERQALRLGIEQFFTKPLDLPATTSAITSRLLAIVEPPTAAYAVSS